MADCCFTLRGGKDNSGRKILDLLLARILKAEASIQAAAHLAVNDPIHLVLRG
jgi:hypothetical protein